MSPSAGKLSNDQSDGMLEVLFAQQLADNEKEMRDKALEKLKGYLVAKSSHGPGLSDEDAMKLWKGLFYCMYMSDKPLIQEELAEEISSLLHIMSNEKDCRTFIAAAFRTFVREWNGIDIFRIDKFMMFVRRLLRQVLVHLKMKDWLLKEVARYVNILGSYVICADDNTNSAPLGLKLHLCTIMLEELAKIGGEDLNHEVILAVIQPYLKVLALSKIKQYREAVSEDIVRHLFRQTDEGADYEENVRRFYNRGTKYIEDLANVEEEAAEDEKKLEEEEATTQDVPLEEAVLDPRAGLVDVCIPQLHPDFKSLAQALQSLGSLKKVSKVNRKLIYKLVRECQDMAEGTYPLTLPPIGELRDAGLSKKEVKDASESLQEFYKSLDNVTSAEDIKKIRDLEEIDPLKNFSVKQAEFRKRKKLASKKAQRKKLKRLNKKNLTVTQKKKRAEQLYAAQANRKKSVENQLCRIAKVNEAPLTPTLSFEMTKSKKGIKAKRQNKTLNTSGFGVSDIVSSDVKTEFSVTSGMQKFQVTPISNEEKKSKKRKKQERVDGGSPKKIKSTSVTKETSNGTGVTEPVSEDMEVTKSTMPEQRAGKKNKNKQKKKGKGMIVSVQNGDSKISNCFHVPDFSSSQNESSSKENVVQNLDVRDIQKKKSKSSIQASSKTKLESVSNVLKSSQNSMPSLIENTPKKVSVGNTPKKMSAGQDNKGIVMKVSTMENGSVKKKKKKTAPKEEEIEKFIKTTRKQMKFEKAMKSPKGIPKTPKGKSIKINLKQNQEHDFKDYAHSIRNSPQIPFSADKLPKAPVLKPSPSPILVGRPSLKLLRKSPTSLSGTPTFKKKSPKAKKFRSQAADFFKIT